jgi:hypothetical protein
MKTFFTIILTCICFVSCHSDDEKLFTYKLKNTSGVGIKIVAFSKSNVFREPIITIIEDGKEIIKNYESDPPLNENIYNYVSFFQGDSIVVNYDNEKKQIFVLETCEGSERNPLNICFYSNQEEIFTFTEEDFENATPCDGDCN